MAIDVKAEILNGIRVIRLKRYHDDRGYFEELWRLQDLAELGLSEPFVQDNHSQSKLNVVRGLHAQHNMGKLLMVLTGAIQLIDVDIRPASPTFGEHSSLILTHADPQVVWIPSGFANGFCVLTDQTDVLYKCTTYFDPSKELRINPMDEALGIAWATSSPILSKHDATAPMWDEVSERLHKGTL